MDYNNNFPKIMIMCATEARDLPVDTMPTRKTWLAGPSFVSTFSFPPLSFSVFKMEELTCYLIYSAFNDSIWFCCCTLIALHVG